MQENKGIIAQLSPLLILHIQQYVVLIYVVIIKQ